MAGIASGMLLALSLLVIQFNYVLPYEPNWKSLDSRPLPSWYDEAKFGIFMHWGVYSYLGMGDAWLPYWWKTGRKDIVKFMSENYSPRFTYADFAPMFTANLFNATHFADLVRRSGARYHVLTSKHCEGFTLWPSRYSWNWNAVDVGPKSDLVQTMMDAFKKVAPQVKTGLYYCQYEWLNPLYLQDKRNNYTTQTFVQDKTYPEMLELINQYKPHLLWSDGDYDAPDTYWKSKEFLSWLYNESPVKETVVTNDRWGKGDECKHGGYLTCHDKYNPKKLQKRKWENAMTLDKLSWGFRRNIHPNEVLSIQEIIKTFAETISCGGNMLMNAGPTHDGRIIPIFEERLLQMGQWLETNREAVYGSKPWIYQNDTLNADVWYTSQLRKHIPLQANDWTSRLYNPQISDGTIVYAIFLKWPNDNKLKLGAPKITAKTKITLIGYEGKFKVKPLDDGLGGLVVDLSRVLWWKLPNTWAWVLKMENLASDFHDPFEDHEEKAA